MARKSSKPASSLPGAAESGLLQTKVQRPRKLETLVERPDLVGRFDAHAKRRVTLISAPAGYGKSMLTAQWDDVFADGAMFKHGNMGQGIYVDPARDFCGVNFALGPNQGGIDWSPGYHRAAAKMLAGS